MVLAAPKMSGQLLDVGCGNKPYRNLFVNVDCYIGLEFDTPESRAANYAEFFYDGHHFPFNDASYDVVLCNQVLEHVFNPEEFLNEIFRILKPDGKLLLSVPFVWDEHLQPLDYARYSSFGLRSLLERHGFGVVELRKMNADARVVFQLINVYLYKILLTPNPKINLLFCAVFMAPVTLLGILLSKVLPANQDLFLNQIVFAIKYAATADRIR
jgi:SAM-dependent methyltransferase